MDDRDRHQEHDDDAAVRDLLQGAARRPELPADELEAITAAAREEWRRTVERVRSAERGSTGGADRRWWAVAAALALAAVLGGWWLLRPGAGPGVVEVARIERVSGTVTAASAEGAARPLTGGEPLAAGTVVTTGTAARAALVLADGTGVRLDAGTRLALAAADRLELQSGAVYVDSGAESVADGGAGLAVHTALGVARDVGTRFTVRLSEGETEMVVRVRDGAVTVTVTAGGGEGRATAGGGLVVGGDGVIRETAVDPWGAGWEWVLEAAPAFPLEGSTVAAFLAWVERETGWTVHYADPAVETAAREIVLHGDPGDLRPDRAPAVVLPAAGLEAEVTDGVLTVSRGAG